MPTRKPPLGLARALRDDVYKVTGGQPIALCDRRTTRREAPARERGPRLNPAIARPFQGR